MKRNVLRDQRGFTLVEIIAVLILLGILAAVAVPRYMDLTANAELRAIQAGVAELNGRENMTWANHKLSTTTYADDTAINTAVLGVMDTDLGTDYTFTATATGGTLQFGSATLTLIRTPCTLTSPAVWR